MKEYTVLPGQSLFDIAVMVYGDVLGVLWLVDDNQLNGPTARILPGDVLKIRPSVISVRTRDYLASYPPIATVSSAELTDGVSFWRTEEYKIQ